MITEFKIFESIRVPFKKYIISSEINSYFNYSIYFIYRNREELKETGKKIKKFDGYNIKIKRIAFYDKDGNEILNVPEREKCVSYVRDDYFVFNPKYNHLYYETDNLKDAKEMIIPLIQSKKYNL